MMIAAIVTNLPLVTRVGMLTIGSPSFIANLRPTMALHVVGVITRAVLIPSATSISITVITAAIAADRHDTTSMKPPIVTKVKVITPTRDTAVIVTQHITTAGPGAIGIAAISMTTHPGCASASPGGCPRIVDVVNGIVVVGPSPSDGVSGGGSPDELATAPTTEL